MRNFSSQSIVLFPLFYIFVEMNGSTHTPMRLSELQLKIKQRITEQFPLPVWVVAEISELKVNYSGHCYLELIEKGERDGLPKAQVRAVIWRSNYASIAGYFEAQTRQRLAAGINILAKVIVNYHELYGISLQISDIDASYTLGDMERRRQATIAQLQQDGVWELNRRQPMPLVVQRLAVVSSRQAAGWQDFYQELKKSPYRFQVELFDAFMQGEAAESSIISALYAIHESSDRFDAVVIIRGGGSTSDLRCFDAYQLCSHIAQFPLPILTGIGHDKDISVADMVAHLSLKTPTAVAGWLIDRMAQVEGWLDGAALQLHDYLQEHLHREAMRLERLTGELQRHGVRLIEREKEHLRHLAEQLNREAHRCLERERERLDRAEELNESHSPRRILQLGFSVVRHRGVAQTDPKSLPAGTEVEIEFASGTRSATLD